MSESENEPGGIRDEDLPEDLQPGEDNPLAEPLTEEEAPDDMDELDMMGGGSSDESGDSEDADESGGSGDKQSTDGESAADDDED